MSVIRILRARGAVAAFPKLSSMGGSLPIFPLAPSASGATITATPANIASQWASVGSGNIFSIGAGTYSSQVNLTNKTNVKVVINSAALFTGGVYVKDLTQCEIDGGWSVTSNNFANFDKNGWLIEDNVDVWIHRVAVQDVGGSCFLIQGHLGNRLTERLWVTDITGVRNGAGANPPGGTPETGLNYSWKGTHGVYFGGADGCVDSLVGNADMDVPNGHAFQLGGNLTDCVVTNVRAKATRDASAVGRQSETASGIRFWGSDGISNTIIKNSIGDNCRYKAASGSGNPSVDYGPIDYMAAIGNGFEETYGGNKVLEVIEATCPTVTDASGLTGDPEYCLPWRSNGTARSSATLGPN